MSPPDYQAPSVKASRCGNERQERSVRRKVGRRGSGKKSGFGSVCSTATAQLSLTIKSYLPKFKGFFKPELS